jgi:hypothetical protein
MAATYLDLVDTAVKIGLGAGISAVSGYLVVRANQSAERMKMFTIRRLDILEKAASHFDEYVGSLSNLIATIDGVRLETPGLEKFNLDNEDHQKRYSFIQKNDKKFCEDSQNATYVVAKLLLLGLKDTATVADNFTKLAQEIRSLVLFELTLPTDAKIESWRIRARELRERFYDGLRANYSAEELH